MLRFSILKDVGKGQEKVVIEYDEKQILSRLQARIAEKLSEGSLLSKKPKFKHSRAAIHIAVGDAFNGLVTEFKEKTVTLT